LRARPFDIEVTALILALSKHFEAVSPDIIKSASARRESVGSSSEGCFLVATLVPYVEKALNRDLASGFQFFYLAELNPVSNRLRPPVHPLRRLI
jgi:hypothetical protein